MIKYRVLTILGCLLCSATLAGCAVVDTGHVGVKKSMGIVDKHLLEPGVHGYNMFLDDIDVYSLKQESESGEASPLTSDQQPITLKFRIQYRIPEKQVLALYTGVAGDPFGTLVVPQVQESFRQVVSQYKADAVISGVTKIKDEVLVRARQSLKGKVDLIDIPITEVDLPKPLQQAIMEKQQMEIAAKKKQYELDKEQKQAEITITKARAEAESIKLQSQALSNSPKLVNLKWVEKWDGHLPQTVTGSSTMLMLPANKTE